MKRHLIQPGLYYLCLFYCQLCTEHNSVSKFHIAELFYLHDHPVTFKFYFFHTYLCMLRCLITRFAKNLRLSTSSICVVDFGTLEGFLENVRNPRCQRRS